MEQKNSDLEMSIELIKATRDSIAGTVKKLDEIIEKACGLSG